jgi:hypothetical protein
VLGCRRVDFCAGVQQLRVNDHSCVEVARLLSLQFHVVKEEAQQVRGAACHTLLLWVTTGLLELPPLSSRPLLEKGVVPL